MRVLVPLTVAFVLCSCGVDTAELCLERAEAVADAHTRCGLESDAWGAFKLYRLACADADDVDVDAFDRCLDRLESVTCESYAVPPVCYEVFSSS